LWPFPLLLLWPFPCPFEWPVPGLVGAGLELGLDEAAGAVTGVDAVVGAGLDTVPAPELEPVVVPPLATEAPDAPAAVLVLVPDDVGRSATETEGETCALGAGDGVASGTETSPEAGRMCTGIGCEGARVTCRMPIAISPEMSVAESPASTMAPEKTPPRTLPMTPLCCRPR